MQQTIRLSKSEIADQPGEKLITITILRKDFSEMVKLMEKRMENVEKHD